MGRSRPFAGRGYLGRVPVSVWEVLHWAWEQPFHISSNFAREAAIAVAFAASMGWITNLGPEGRTYSRKWHVTQEGLVALTHRGDLET